MNSPFVNDVIAVKEKLIILIVNFRIPATARFFILSEVPVYHFIRLI